MARFCPNCGTEVDDTAVFCPTCGQPIDQASETEIPAAPAWPDPVRPAGAAAREEPDEPAAAPRVDGWRRDGYGRRAPSRGSVRGPHARRGGTLRRPPSGRAAPPVRARAWPPAGAAPGQPAGHMAGHDVRLAHRRRCGGRGGRRARRPVRRRDQPDRRAAPAPPARHRRQRLLPDQRAGHPAPAPRDVRGGRCRVRHRRSIASASAAPASASCSCSWGPPRRPSAPSSSSSVATSRWVVRA